MMDAIEEWKLIATIVIFCTGCIGAAVAPVSHWMQGKVASDEEASSSDGGAHDHEHHDHGHQHHHHHHHHHHPQSPLSIRVLRASERFAMSVGCGVMLATAMIHILPEADSNIAAAGYLQNMESPYPLAATICTGMILVVFIFHVELHHHVDRTHQPLARMHTLEGGLVVHSVLIGFALGSSDTTPSLRSLAIAMMFHQLCEGFAMGGAVRDAAQGPDGISALHQAVMIFLFGASTPLGIIIGWFAVANSDQASSGASVGAQGILDAAAAGILICAALCDFMPELYGLTAHEHSEPEAVETGVPVATAMIDVTSNALVLPSPVEGAAENISGSESSSSLTNRLPPPPDVHSHRSGNEGIVRVSNHIGILLGAAAMAVLALWS